MAEFITHTYDELLREGMSVISNTVDKSENAMVWDAVSAGALIAYELEVFAKRAFDLMDIENNHGDDLNRFVFQRTGIMRRPPMQAVGILKVTYSRSPLSLGPLTLTRKDRLSDGEHLFRPSKAVTFDGFSGADSNIREQTKLVAVESIVAGNIGDIPPNTEFIVPEAHGAYKAIKATNPETIYTGYDGDTDENLKKRYYEYLQNKATSNNPAHYRMWANEVPGVGQARVYRAGPTPLSVKVVILDNRFKAAPPDLVEAVRQHIEEKQSFDVDHLEVVSATVVPLNIAVSLELEKGYTDEKVKKIIKKNIDDFLSQSVDRNFERRVISFYDIASVIIRTEGVLDIKALTLNGAADNIQLSDYEVVEIGDVT
ncbi:MAG: baseplate J/gp47 family protein [Clostridiales bacterium]|nr:baseplate J/gp47 family protein [Clostridiales bacterium]